MRRHVLAVLLASTAPMASTAGQMKTTARPRTPVGHPDRTGVYDLATVTPLERPNGKPAVMTDEEAATLEKQVADQNRAADKQLAADRTAPPVGGDGSIGAAG